jgi:lipopolysaccharide biosynthesis protein
MKTLVVYVFHKQNEFVDTFLKYGIFQDPQVDFVMVCNDPTLKLDVPSYVTYMNRENKGWDFGGWSHGLLTNDRYKNYDTFICINSTAMGPFLPRWCTKTWVDVFCDELGDNVHLVGPTINCIRSPRHSAHVQSYCFAMTRTAMDRLIESQIFSVTKFSKDKIDAVNSYEIRMSREIIAAGWNIAALVYYPREIDWTFKDKTPEELGIAFLGDIAFPGWFYQQTVHPYECVFMKANRGQNLEWLRTYRMGNHVRKLVADPIIEIPIASIDSQSC